jgi:hypothetical protein
MSDIGGTTPNKTIIAVGVLTIALGVIPLLAMSGVLPRGNPPTDPAPAWMGWLIGATFVGAGLIVVMRGASGSIGDSSGALPASAPRLLRAANDLLSVGIVWSLAVLITWVAFGPGPRHFSVTGGGLSVLTSGSGDTIGRVAFGIGSIMCWCVAAAVTAMTVRRWRR